MAGRFPRWVGRVLVVFAPAALGVAAVVFQPEPLVSLRNILFDGFQRASPRSFDAASAVRVVDIDEESLARYGQWPWPRVRLAEAVRQLGELGAAAVGLDVILSEPDRSSPARVLDAVPDGPAKQAVLHALGVADGDAALADALGTVPAVLGLLTSDEVHTSPGPKAGLVEAGDPARPFLPRFSGAVAPLPDLAARAVGVGAFNWVPERDFVVRRVPLLVGAGDHVFPSFALEVVRVALGASTIQVKASNASGETSVGGGVGILAVRVAGPAGEVLVPAEPDGAMRVHYAGAQDRRRIPFWRLAEQQVAGSEVEGRIVLIGSSAAVLNDVRATPLNRSVAGVEIHADMIEQIRAGVTLRRPLSAPVVETLAVLFLCASAGAAVLRLRPAAAAALAAALLAVPSAVAWTAFSDFGLVLDPIPPSLALLGTYLGASLGVYRVAERERRAIRLAFEHYVAPEIVERLASDPKTLRLGGETREITVLFSDLRGFTARAERMSAQEVIGLLNAVHAPMTEAVLGTRGTVDKYLGDGLMAFWNAPLEDERHVEHACRAALAMVASLPALGRRVAPVDGPGDPVEIGIGLHVGYACVGNVGSTLRFDYSIVGDAVNVAARLEPQSQVYGVPIVVSAAVVARAPDFGFVPLGDVLLKGKAEAITAFALHGAPETLGQGFRAFLRAHEAARAAVTACDPQAPRRIREAAAHPDAAPYARLYASWLALHGTAERRQRDLIS